MVKANWPWVGCVGGIRPLWTAAVNKEETVAINICAADPEKKKRKRQRGKFGFFF